MIEAGPLVRVRLDLCYDGTDFSGWAVQPGRRTVQGELQDALADVLRVPPVPPVHVTVAGRTDAGVHASGQVAHLDVRAQVWAAAEPTLRRQLNGRLPRDVRVRAVMAAPPGFDARFSALWRRYVYRLGDAEWGVDPLRRHTVLACARRLDTEAMAQAATALLGLHDFAAFCRARPDGTTVRTLLGLEVVRTGDEVVCTVVADAFCHSMVRSLVGALVAVGQGRRPVSWPASLLSRQRRADDVPVLPALGLTLAEVAYPDEDQLAVRAEQTRALRGSPSGGPADAGAPPLSPT